jgi:hypothetical protein
MEEQSKQAEQTRSIAPGIQCELSKKAPTGHASQLTVAVVVDTVVVVVPVTVVEVMEIVVVVMVVVVWVVVVVSLSHRSP